MCPPEPAGRRPPTDLPRIGAPARRALEGAGITALEALTRLSEADVARLHGMGPKALERLRAALAEQGLTFLQD